MVLTYYIPAKALERPYSWRAVGFPCSWEEKKQVKQEQRAAGSWTLLRVWSWSTQTLLPNSSARQNPGTAAQTDKQQTAWAALHGLTNTPLDGRCITIHFALAVFLPLPQNRYCKAQLLWLGLYVSSRGVIFPRKHLLDISFILNQIQKLCLHLQRY